MDKRNAASSRGGISCVMRGENMNLSGGIYEKAIRITSNYAIAAVFFCVNVC